MKKELYLLVAILTFLAFCPLNVTAYFPSFIKPSPVHVAISGNDAILNPVRMKKTDKKLGYSIEAYIPQITGSRSAVAKDFNVEVTKLIDSENHDCYENSGLTPDGDSKDATRHRTKYSLSFYYETYITGPDILSLVIYECYFVGGPHNEYKSFSINYDLKANKDIQLKELFPKDADYLKQICDKGTDILKKQHFDYQDAPGPNDINTWVLTERGLLVIFDPYIVGCFADGFIAVIIPYKELAGFRQYKA
jgi:hypothetical protein